jgi:hypothetical protein
VAGYHGDVNGRGPANKKHLGAKVLGLAFQMYFPSLAMGHGPILVPGCGTISVPAPLRDSTDHYHPQKGDASSLAAAHTDSTH